MPENRKRILDMLEEGKITVDEAERLLSLVDEPSPSNAQSEAPHVAEERRHPPKYLRVVVEPSDANNGSGDRVNIRVPMALIRAGMKLPAMMPSGVAKTVNAHLADNGIDIDVREIKAEDLEGLVDALSDLEIDVQDEEEKVRVYFE